MAWMVRRSMPGQEKIVSFTMAPASRAPNCKPRDGDYGMVALPRAWR
jgi:hypothetical protein